MMTEQVFVHFTSLHPISSALMLLYVLLQVGFSTIIFLLAVMFSSMHLIIISPTPNYELNSDSSTCAVPVSEQAGVKDCSCS